MFATLDSAVGEIYIQELGKSVVISDTIGFIKDLPPELIEAFTSTLLESISADVVLHVIDASDPDLFGKIDVVEEILHHLAVPEEKVILVFNKVDANPAVDREKIAKRTVPYPHVFLGHDRESEELLATILPRLKK